MTALRIDQRHAGRVITQIDRWPQAEPHLHRLVAEPHPYKLMAAGRRVYTVKIHPL